MKIVDVCRRKVAGWPYIAITLLASLASFGCYTSMYAFRKAFAAGTFSGEQYFGADYKVWLIIAQMLGYMLSKFYGIRYIAETGGGTRTMRILLLVGIAWAALLAFALVPAPYNIVFMFINGFPLGMIWGLVFGYVEGRRSTEIIAAVMSISLIFASGFVKTVARTIMDVLPVNEYWMPFCTGLLFVAPFLLFTACLAVLPAPNALDQQQRNKREPMCARERKQFMRHFLPGIIITLVIYVLLTIARDIRDNFEVEIWSDLGIRNNHIYTQTDSIISLVVLLVIGLLILVKDNLKAFTFIHFMIIAGALLLGISTVLYSRQQIGPVTWMSLAGLGLYLGYIPYNAVFFERMIATFKFKSNAGFVIYVADAAGYLGTVSALLLKEFYNGHVSWGLFFRNGAMVVAIVGGAGALLSLVYFRHKVMRHEKRVVSYADKSTNFNLL